MQCRQFGSHSVTEYRVHLSSPSSFVIHHSVGSPACSHHSLPASAFFFFFWNPPLWTFFPSHTQTLKDGVIYLISVQHLSWSHPHPPSPLSLPPLLALPHDDTDSAAEIKGRALITDSAKCRPAAQGIRPHYKNSRLRAVMTNHAQQPLGNTEPSLPCCVKPWHRLMLFGCACFCD